MAPQARAQPRSRLTSDLSAHLVLAADRSPIKALAVDVSRSGMGLVCFAPLAEATDVILVLKIRGVSLKVVWCKQDSVRKDVFHIGLQSHDPAINVEKLLQEEGLIPRERAATLSFEALRDTIAVVHSTDNQALRSSSYSSLTERYHPYPVRFAGSSLLVLLPKDLKPAEAAKLSEEGAAERKIMVLKLERGATSVVWPPAES